MAKKTTARKPVKVLKKKSTKTPAKKKAAAEVAPEEDTFNPAEHMLVPSHAVLSQEEVETLFTAYKVSPQNLPVIFVTDAALKGLNAKMGDIIKITRASQTAGTAVFYRRVAYE